MAKRMMWAGAAMLCAATALAACQKNAAQDVAASSAAPASGAAANVQPIFAGGVVNTLTSNNLTIMANGAPVTFQLTPATTIMVTHKGSLADIKAGVFLGATNTPSADGSGQSTEVHVFPPGVKMGEGDRPMGPAPAGGGGATRMTNGTVSTASPASGGQRMTNGAAGNVASTAQGVQMDVVYEGGTRHIVVSPTTPITVMGSAKPEDLKPGTNVLVGYVPAADGSKSASFINIQP